MADIIDRLNDNENCLDAVDDAIREIEQLRTVLKRALMNEGVNGCTRPIIGFCLCWRCEAEKLLNKAF